MQLARRGFRFARSHQRTFEPGPGGAWHSVPARSIVMSCSASPEEHGAGGQGNGQQSDPLETGVGPLWGRCGHLGRRVVVRGRIEWAAVVGHGAQCRNCCGRDRGQLPLARAVCEFFPDPTGNCRPDGHEASPRRHAARSCASISPVTERPRLLRNAAIPRPSPALLRVCANLLGPRGARRQVFRQGTGTTRGRALSGACARVRQGVPPSGSFSR